LSELAAGGIALGFRALDLMDRTLRAAREVLFEALSEGGARDTAEYKRYKEYKDAYILARERYNQAKLTAELSTDNAVQQQWQNVTEPALREAIDKLNSDWELQGAKSRIETALSALEVLRTKAPVVTWSEWSHRFDPSIAGLTDAAGTRFMPTFFSQKFSVTGAEVDRLITEAPPELRARLAAGTGALDVDALTFEYSSARLTRTWCDGALFEARFWKFDDAGRRISAGRDGYAGECPLYAAGAVFARNIQATLKPAAASSAALATGRNVNLGAMQLAPRLQTSVARDHRGDHKPGTQVMRGAAHPPAKGTAAAHQLDSARKARTVARRDIARRDPRLLVKVAPPRAPASPHGGPTPPRPSAAPAMQATDPEAIYILGFICNLVRAPCPNPGPALFGG